MSITSQSPATTGTQLLVAEIFGPTIQGEGPSVGRRASFLRLSGCNLACTWCDTPYTWDWKRYNPAAESQRMSDEEIIDELNAQAMLSRQAPQLLVVTGGEPLLQQAKFLPLLQRLQQEVFPGLDIEVETNGTIMPLPLMWTTVSFNVSPKLANSGNAPHLCINDEVLAAHAGSVFSRFKFVCSSEDDLQEVEVLHHSYGILRDHIWIMPEGIDVATVQDNTRKLIQPTIDHGFNFTTRLHILAWGNKRGR